MIIENDKYITENDLLLVITINKHNSSACRCAAANICTLYLNVLHITNIRL